MMSDGGNVEDTIESLRDLVSQAQTAISTLTTTLNSHAGNRSNPHGVNPGQIGAMSATPGWIEFQPGAENSFGGFLDFHFQGSQADYTSRIIESANGTIQVNNVTCTNDKNPAVAQARNIYAGTGDIGAGASLSTGAIYLVYE